MPNPLTDHNGSSEVVFDVTKPTDGIAFLGLLDRSGEPGNKLTGLFDWQCHGCGSLNRDAAMVEPQQAFLSRWLCRHCEQATIVRFRARGSAEWVAEHTLAITGKALCHLAEDELATDAVATETRLRKRASQRLFAWIAIPALLMLVFLGLRDMQSPSSSSASPAAIGQEPQRATALSRLPGLWVSEDGKDQLYFGRLDTASRRGTCVHFSGNRRPGDRFWFDVTHEGPRGEQLVISPWRKHLEGAEAHISPATDVSEATIYIPLQGGALTWIDIQGGRPIFKVYRRVNDRSAPESPPDLKLFKN